ncbi:MAG: hypothetical protein DRJ36_02290 [Thermoprotei archaeon]|nr:MAG: hypothetical protein DRJ36_02290 [Thermoprotei archaeon]
MSSIMMALEDLKKDAWRRRETDYIMPIWLPFLPTILVVVGIIAMFSSAFVGAFAVIGLIQFFMGIILIFIGAIVGIFVIYKWINRRNDHFKRQHLFLGALLDILKGLSQQKGVNTDVLIAQIERDYREAEVEETEKSAVLWGYLTSVSFMSSLVLHSALLEQRLLQA